MQVNVHQAKSQLSKLMEKALEGEEVIIARAGKPTVKIVPVGKQSKKKRVLGTMKGKIWIADDFDAPLPKEIEDSFYGIGPEE